VTIPRDIGAAVEARLATLEWGRAFCETLGSAKSPAKELDKLFRERVWFAAVGPSR
jgi:hypothetical protein